MFDVHIGSVNDDGIGGYCQRGYLTGFIALVTLLLIGEDYVIISFKALLLKLIAASSGPTRGVCVKVKLEPGLGKNHRSLIATFGDYREALPGDTPLLLDEDFTDGGEVGDFVGLGGYFREADVIGYVDSVEQDAIAISPADKLNADLAGESFQGLGVIK